MIFDSMLEKVAEMAVRELLLCLAMLSMSCSTSIKCPETDDGVKAALLDHGKHASLIVQSGEQKMVRYGFGDWRYYALAQEGFVNGARALFWPTQAGLGRKELSGPFEKRFIDISLPVRVERIWMFNVDKTKAKELRGELDAIFREYRSTLHVNRRYDLEFVHHPKTYWALNNSNQEIALWMRKLGCRSRGTALFSVWNVEKSEK